MTSRKRYLVAYDVADDKRRNQVFRTLSGYGDRAQYSVFFCEVNPRELAELRGKLHRTIHDSEDQGMILKLGAATQPLETDRVCVTGVGLYLCSFFWSQYCCIYTTTGGDLMDTVRTLEEKRERVLEQMRAIRSMRPGSVTEQYLKVTHKGKRKPVMRGPYWVYTRKEAGKTVGQRLSREDAEQVTKDIEAHRKFVALCKEFETLTMRLGDVEVDAVLSPEKKRPRSRSSRTKR